jgi:hypothetical protein
MFVKCPTCYGQCVVEENVDTTSCPVCGNTLVIHAATAEFHQIISSDDESTRVATSEVVNQAACSLMKEDLELPVQLGRYVPEWWHLRSEI